MAEVKKQWDHNDPETWHEYDRRKDLIVAESSEDYDRQIKEILDDMQI